MRVVITEKLWDIAASEYRSNEYDTEIDFQLDVSTRIMKKEVSFVSGGSYINGRYLIDEIGYKKISDFLMNDIVNRYELIPSHYILMSSKKSVRFASKSAQKLSLFDDEGLMKFPKYLFGKDIVISLFLGEYDDIRISGIIYSSESLEDVTKILTELRELHSQVRIDSGETTISVKFMMFNSGISNIYDRIISLKDNVSEKALFPEDIKEEQIVNFLKSNDSGIVIFYGVPGGGKSSYIKHLILDNPELCFYIADGGTIEKLDYLKKNLISSTFSKGIKSKDDRNKVFIIEDCEKILESRESNRNSGISDLLNLSDGIIGDLVGCKFILTFNSDKNIDPAILRKGRTKFMYEFKPVKGARLEELAKISGITLTPKDRERGLTLAEIFNYDNDNYNKEKTKLGF